MFYFVLSLMFIYDVMISLLGKLDTIFVFKTECGYNLGQSCVIISVSLTTRTHAQHV